MMKKYKIYIYFFLFLFSYFLEAKIESKNIVLDNGMKVLIVKNPRIPIVNIVIGVNIGSKDETDGTNGWVHLFEHLILFSGTKDKSNDDIISEIRGKGGYINAHTDRESMTFELSLPSEHTKYGLEIVKAKVFDFKLEESVLKREKNAVEYELKQILNDPVQVGSSLVFNAIFKGHPYHRPSYGNIDIIRKASIDELNMFYENYFSFGNCSLVIIGDIDLADIEKQILNLFNKKSEKKIIKKQIVYQIGLKKNIVIKQKMDIEQTNITLGFFAPNYNSEDFAALRVLTQIVGGGANALLKVYLYRNNIFPANFSMKYVSLKYGGVILVNFSIENKNAKKAKNKVVSFLKKMRKIKFTITDYLPVNRRYGSDLLLRAKNYFRFISEEFKEKGLDTAVSLARFLLLDEGSRKKIKKLDEITSKDLRKIVKKYFSTKYIFIELKPLEMKK